MSGNNESFKSWLKETFGVGSEIFQRCTNGGKVPFSDDHSYIDNPGPEEVGQEGCRILLYGKKKV